MLYLICYDIVSNKQRKKLSDTLLDYGDRIQKSAFECDLKSEAKLRELLRRATPFVDVKTDTLRVYRVCGSCVGERQLVGIKLEKPIPATIIL